MTLGIVTMARGLQQNGDSSVADGQVAVVVGDGGVVASQPFTDLQARKCGFSAASGWPVALSVLPMLLWLRARELW